jgi:hypothetical protein
MNHTPQQIADPQMLRKLHNFTSSPTNSIITSADEILADIWCGPKPITPQTWSGYGACEKCFGYRLLLGGICNECSALVRVR